MRVADAMVSGLAVVVLLGLAFTPGPGRASAPGQGGVASPADGVDDALDDDDDDLDDDDIEVLEEVTVVDPAALAWRAEDWPRTDRAINVLGPRTSRAGTLLLSIDHRTWQAFTKRPFADFLGFDAGGLKIGLGLRYGVFDGVDVGLYRLNNGGEAFDVYELDARWQILRQGDHGLDLAVRAGGTWFFHPDAADASGTFAQLALERRFGERLGLGAGVLFHSESTNDRKRDVDVAGSLGIPVWVDVRLTPSIAWRLEAVFNVAGYGSSWPGLSTAIVFMTHRHSFAVVVSNNPYLSADGIATNTWRGLGDLIIGFSILREIAL